jgi:hypothetical protein
MTAAIIVFIVMYILTALYAYLLMSVYADVYESNGQMAVVSLLWPIHLAVGVGLKITGKL